MSDNTQLSTAVGAGDTIRDKDRAGVKTQILGIDINVGGASEILMQAGQQPMASCVPVALASDQTAVPVSTAVLPLPAGAATEVSLANLATLLSGTLTVSVSALPAGLATSARQDTGNTSLASLDAKTPALGQALAAASVPVVLTTAQLATLTPLASVTISGSVAVTGTFWQATQPVSLADGQHITFGAESDAAAAADTSTATYLSLFKRLLQRVTSLIALLPAAIGRTTMAGSLSVAVASDQAAVPVSGTVTSSQGGAPWSQNLTQLTGSAVDTNSGLKSAGTLRVVLATDQPQLTNKTLVTPDSVALPAHQSVNLDQWNGVAPTAAALLADAASLPTAPTVGAAQYLYNGTTLDLMRGQVEGTLLASAARTAYTISADLTAHNAHGIFIWLRVTAVPAVPGTGGLQLTLLAKDPTSLQYVNITTPPALITAVGTYGYEVHPGASTAVPGSTAGYLVQRTAGVLPRTFAVQVNPGDAQSYTYSVGYCLIP